MEPTRSTNTTQATSPQTRLMLAVVGITVGAALYDPLELDDLPGSLRGRGYTAPVLWSLIAALWFWAVWRLDGIWSWGRRNRRALLRLARHGGVYYGPILVALFYLMWVAGRVWLGDWPQAIPMHDPKGMPTSAVVHMLICGWFWYWPVAIALPVVRFVYVVKMRLPGAAEHVGEAAVTLIFILLAAQWLATDPHQLVRWFLD